MDEEQPTPAALGEAIARADDGRRTAEPPLPRGWAGLVEKDRRARAKSHPNAAGGYFTILYPWRLYIAVGGAAVVVLLLLIDLLT